MPDIDEKNRNNKCLPHDRLHEIGGYSGSTDGTEFIARFCNAIKHGETPSEKDLKFIAHALEPLKTYYMKEKATTDNSLRDALDDFARRMKLKKKQGKRASETFGDSARMALSVVRYSTKVKELISNGSPNHEAEKQALSWSSDEEKIGPKAMKNRIKKYMHMVEAINNLLQ